MNLQGLDLAGWMKAHVRFEDEVTLVVDVGGREHALLAHLLRGGALPLADQVLVRWHTQHLVRLLLHRMSRMTSHPPAHLH